MKLPAYKIIHTWLSPNHGVLLNMDISSHSCFLITSGAEFLSRVHLNQELLKVCLCVLGRTHRTTTTVLFFTTVFEPHMNWYPVKSSVGKIWLWFVFLLHFAHINGWREWHKIKISLIKTWHLSFVIYLWDVQRDHLMTLKMSLGAFLWYMLAREGLFWSCRFSGAIFQSVYPEEKTNSK